MTIPVGTDPLAAELLFSTNGRTPIVGFFAALTRVRRRMAVLAGCEIAHFTVHDLRRSTATGMAELGISEHVVDRVLNHSGRRVSGTARIYNRSEYLPERRRALDAWSAHVARLVQSRPGGVVPLRVAQ